MKCCRQNSIFIIALSLTETDNWCQLQLIFKPAQREKRKDYSELGKQVKLAQLFFIW